MRNADSADGRSVYTGKRTYSNVNVAQTTYDFKGNEARKDVKLPPISGDTQQMLNFLVDEVGVVLFRSKGKIETILKEFKLYDPLEKGLIPQGVACEILKRYKVPPNVNYQKKVVACFVNPSAPGKVNRMELQEFLQNSRNIAMERTDTGQHEKGQYTEQKLADSTQGRYDSSATSTSTSRDHEYEPRKAEAVKQAFSDRRDAGLIIQIERAFRSSTVDPATLIDKLEDSLQRKCRNDDNLVAGTQVNFPYKNYLYIITVESLYSGHPL